MRFKNPEIIDYVVIYAEQGTNLTKICQEEYSSSMIDKIGMETLRNNCIEENADGILKWGERILVPIYKEKGGEIK